MLITRRSRSASPQAPGTSRRSEDHIDLNTATIDQLDVAARIGKKPAERILESRPKSGGSKKIEE